MSWVGIDFSLLSLWIFLKGNHNYYVNLKTCVMWWNIICHLEATMWWSFGKIVLLLVAVHNFVYIHMSGGLVATWSIVIFAFLDEQEVWFEDIWSGDWVTYSCPMLGGRSHHYLVPSPWVLKVHGSLSVICCSIVFAFLTI